MVYVIKITVHSIVKIILYLQFIYTILAIYIYIYIHIYIYIYVMVTFTLRIEMFMTSHIRFFL